MNYPFSFRPWSAKADIRIHMGTRQSRRFPLIAIAGLLLPAAPLPGQTMPSTIASDAAPATQASDVTTQASSPTTLASPATQASAAATAPSEAAAPAPILSPADQMLQDMLKPPSTQPSAIAPVASAPVSAVLLPGGHHPGSALDFREGSNVVDRIGHLRKVPDSAYKQFVFDNTDVGGKLPPMYVLPNLKLMQMENLMSSTHRDLHFTVSGIVTEYKSGNYILLDAGPADQAHLMSPPMPVAPPGKNISADQMLNQMLGSDAKPAAPRLAPAPSPIGHVPDATSGSAAVAPDAPLIQIRREGSQIIDRMGRLTRSADGQQEELTFDADGSAMQDPPLIILPNLKLGAMETATAASSRDQRFRVTGTLTEYRGRNYVLLEKVVVVPEYAQQF